MRGNILADSSFFIRRFRAGANPFDELAEHLPAAELITCGVVVTEVVRGIKVPVARDKAANLFGCMVFVPTHNRIWDRVTKLAWELDRRGCTMQVTDLVIAVSALEVDAAVLAFDSDFPRVPGLRVLETL